jgi:phosphoribosyl 1,2-cyclic phosphodiesterase
MPKRLSIHKNRCRVKFWGVRGSIPSPGPGTAHYGGNTSCIEIRADNQIVVLDAGSGIRPLGLALGAEFAEQPMHLTLVISHTHWDHIQGFPFFLPAYDAKNSMTILGYEGTGASLRQTLAGQMESPYFPIAMRSMPGNLTFKDLKKRSFSIGNIKARSIVMNHPGLTTGYRFETSGGTVVYMPDNEPAKWIRGERMIDPKQIEFVRNADILIADSQYGPNEYEQHLGWGHGCVDDVVELACRAEVRRLFLFHHDPDHDDLHVASLVDRARKSAKERNARLRIDGAREGEEILLRRGTAA